MFEHEGAQFGGQAAARDVLQRDGVMPMCPDLGADLGFVIGKEVQVHDPGCIRMAGDPMAQIHHCRTVHAPLGEDQVAGGFGHRFVTVKQGHVGIQAQAL